MIGVLSECDPGSEVGWEAGIRTPIPWSRATCPTVGRPPSASRGVLRRREIPIVANPEKDQQPPLLALGVVDRRSVDAPRLGKIVGPDHLLRIRAAACRV